jgi:membrane-bound lytic murein transglycosylase B
VPCPPDAPPTSAITRIHFLTQLTHPCAISSRSLRDRLLAGALAGLVSVAMTAPALAAEPAPTEATSAPSAPAAKPAKVDTQSAAKNSAAKKRKPSAAQQRASKGAKASTKASAKAKANAAGPAYASRPEVMRFADDMAAQRNLDRDWVRRAIGQARHIPAVVKLMQPPTKPFVKNWAAYRSRFIDDTRIAAGLKFWQSHAATLARAEKEYGVPQEIIVGIIGVETIYGQNTGNFRVMDALTTLAFDFPATHPRAAERSEFFKRELEQFLSHQNRLGTDPMLALGSYAGAMGLPQFMPSSWVRFAVDFDGDDKIDLWNSPADAIGSVGSYFKAFNWQTGMPTHYPVSFDKTRLDMDGLMAPDILPTFSVASFTAKGAVLEGEALQHKGPLALIELLNGPDAPSFVAGTDNFYVITRYNWSSYYAMAVIELGQAVAREMAKAP